MYKPFERSEYGNLENVVVDRLARGHKVAQIARELNETDSRIRYIASRRKPQVASVRKLLAAIGEI